MRDVGPLCKVAYSKGMAPGLVARMVLCSLVAITASARAERRPVAVIDVSATVPARDLVRSLNTALNNHADLKPLDNPVINAALQGEFEDEDAPHVAAAKRRKAEADDFLTQQLDDANAARSAQQGMQELASVNPTYPEMLGLYADLAFAYGQAQLGLKKPNEASLAFQLAARLDPSRAPDPTRYPPNVMAAYSAAVKKPTIGAKLVVRGTGRVWIDGIELGPAGEAYDTSEGLHVVQLTGPDRETRGDRVAVPSSEAGLNLGDAKLTDELKVKRARIAMARARDATERASAMKKLTGLLGVGDAVLIVKDGTALRVQTWRNKEQGFSALVEHRNEMPDELLRPLAPPSTKEKRPEPVGPPPFVEPPRPWYNKNWIRASIAGGVIVTVVGAILYSRRDKFLGPIDMDPKWKDQ